MSFDADYRVARLPDSRNAAGLGHQSRNTERIHALEAARMGTYVWHIETGSIEWDEGHLRLWGYREADFDGNLEGFLRVIHPDDREDVISSLEECAATAADWEHEFRIIRPDGVAWILTSGGFEADASGRGRILRGVVAESTRRKRAEIELQESKSYLAALIDSIDGIVWEVNPITKQFTFVSSRAEELLGYPVRQWLEEKNFWVNKLHPEDREYVTRFCSEKARSTRHFDLSYRMIAANGSAVWISDFVTVVHLADGSRRLRGILTDITDRVEADERIKSVDRRFRALIENNPSCIELIDEEHHTTYASPSVFDTLGIAQTRKIGRDAFADCHPDDRESVTDRLFRIHGNPGKRIPIAWRNRHRDGKWIHLEGIATNLLRDEAVRAIVLNYRDVSEQLRLGEELRQSQKLEAVGRLAGGVAHDFNNILTIIQGYGSLLRMEEDWFSDEVRHAIREIVDAAERAGNLTQQLLAFSRRQVMQTRVFDLNRNIANITKLLGRLVGEDVSMEIDLFPEKGLVQADAGMIDQILMNLVINSRDAMPGGGRLRISTGTLCEAGMGDDERGAPHVFFRVSDDGGGISEKNLEKIFDPFFTTKEQGKGTGLGLSTVFGIVEQHRGKIRVESKVGVGTTFTVLFPESTELEWDGDDPSFHPGDERGVWETVLLVEDEKPVRVLIRLLLERAGYRVVDANDGAEALQIWRERTSRFHLLLTDIVMPGGIDGFELSKRLRKEDPDLKVLFMSGYSPEVAGR